MIHFLPRKLRSRTLHRQRLSASLPPQGLQWATPTSQGRATSPKPHRQTSEASSLAHAEAALGCAEVEACVLRAWTARSVKFPSPQHVTAFARLRQGASLASYRAKVKAQRKRFLDVTLRRGTRRATYTCHGCCRRR